MGAVTDQIDAATEKWDSLPNYGLRDGNGKVDAFDALFLIPVLIVSLNLFGFVTSSYTFSPFGFSFQLADVFFSTSIPVIGTVEFSYATIAALLSYGSIYSTNQFRDYFLPSDTDQEYAEYRTVFSQSEFLVLGAGLLVILGPVFSQTAASILAGQYMSVIGFVISMVAAYILAYY